MIAGRQACSGNWSAGPDVSVLQTILITSGWLLVLAKEKAESGSQIDYNPQVTTNFRQQI